MCSPRNTGNINFSLWLSGGLSQGQGCPDFQKVYVFKVYVPFSCPIEIPSFLVRFSFFHVTETRYKMSQEFRVGFWQNGFFADFYFWAAGVFRGFSPGVFLQIFVGKKVPRKILQENPGKVLQSLQNKNPPIGRGKNMS